MPTINQLVRKGRQTGVTKSTAPALQHGWTAESVLFPAPFGPMIA